MESLIRSADGAAEVSQENLYCPISRRVSARTQWRSYTGMLILNDVLLTGLAFLMAGWIRFNVPLPVFNLRAEPSVPTWTLIVFAFVPMWVTIFTIQGLYSRQNLLGGMQEYAGVFRATSVGILIIVIAGFLQPLFTPARGWVLLAWLFTVAFIIIGRFFLRRLIYALRLRGYYMSPALIIGANGEALSLATQLALWRTSGLAILGFVSDRLPPGSNVYGGLPIVGCLDNLEELVEEHQIEELILATSAISQEQTLSIFKTFGVREDVSLRLSSGLFEVITTGLVVKEIASVPLVQVNQARLTGLDWLLKSAMDVVLGVIFFAVALPFMLAIALAIRLDSPGPVLYRRRVVGLRGEAFDAFKFRTMVTNGDEVLATHPELKQQLETDHKLKEDPRITRIGHILRRTSLDELPQLANVLRREMSLVGPRMIAPDELRMYDKWDMNLLTVLPGITGLWQVSGRSDVSYEERVQLDMRYIRNWSIWLDLHILMRTVSVVLKGKGAY